MKYPDEFLDSFAVRTGGFGARGGLPVSSPDSPSLVYSSFFLLYLTLGRLLWVIIKPRCLIVILIAVVTGCTTVQPFPAYNAANYSNLASTTENNGLKISIDPIFDGARQMEYFGIDQASGDFLAIYIQVENINPNASYLIQKNNFQLSLGHAPSASTEQNATYRSKTGESIGDIGGTLISLPLIFISANMQAQATNVQQNLISKEFKDQTLSFNQRATGFMYFKINNQQLSSIKKGALNVKILNTYTQQTNQFSLPLSHE